MCDNFSYIYSFTRKFRHPFPRRHQFPQRNRLKIARRFVHHRDKIGETGESSRNFINPFPKLIENKSMSQNLYRKRAYNFTIDGNLFHTTNKKSFEYANAYLLKLCRGICRAEISPSQRGRINRLKYSLRQSPFPRGASLYISVDDLIPISHYRTRKAIFSLVAIR